jgi:competence protein ComEA
MMNRAWVVLMGLACAGIAGGDDVRAAERGQAVLYQVPAEKAATDTGAACGERGCAAESSGERPYDQRAQGARTWDVEEQEGAKSPAAQDPASEEKSGAKGEGKASEGKPSQTGAGRGKAGRASQGHAGDSGALIDVNKASAEQLEALPGIGASMASRIVEYRQKHGPFKRLDDLMGVRGIGEKNFLKLKPLITIGAASKGDQ